MGGINKVVEIDECLLRGKRKANRGRYLSMDRWRATLNILSETNNDRQNNRNVERYGNRINGRWVVGICLCDVDADKQRKLLESRFFIVSKRDKKTLIRLILQEVEFGTKIFTDEWASYKSLRIYGYEHITINHSREYVTPEGHHSNTVEVVWHHLKTKIFRNMSGVPESKLDSYLCEEWMRSKFNDSWDFFKYVLNTIASIYPLN